MKKHQVMALAILVASLILASLPSAAKDKGDAGRLLTGSVIDKQDSLRRYFHFVLSKSS